jgi:hypothetical protein
MCMYKYVYSYDVCVCVCVCMCVCVYVCVCVCVYEFMCMCDVPTDDCGGHQTEDHKCANALEPLLTLSLYFGGHGACRWVYDLVRCSDTQMLRCPDTQMPR